MSYNSQPSKEANKSALPPISNELMARYQRCSSDCVARERMCAGCLKGQFYCNVFEKFRAIGK